MNLIIESFYHETNVFLFYVNKIFIGLFHQHTSDL